MISMVNHKIAMEHRSRAEEGANTEAFARQVAEFLDGVTQRQPETISLTDPTGPRGEELPYEEGIRNAVSIEFLGNKHVYQDNPKEACLHAFDFARKITPNPHEQAKLAVLLIEARMEHHGDKAKIKLVEEFSRNQISKARQEADANDKFLQVGDNEHVSYKYDRLREYAALLGEAVTRVGRVLDPQATFDFD